MSSFFYVFLGLGITAAFIGLLYLVRAVYRAIAVRQQTFSDGHASLFIDEQTLELVVTQEDRAGIHRLKLGTLTWRDTGTHVSVTSFKLPRAFANRSFDQYDKTDVLDGVEVWVGRNNAGSLMRWLNHRTARLAPDVAGYVRELNAQKKQIAAEARAHLPEVPVVECDAGMLIEHYAYLAFLPSGFVYGMRGAGQTPKPVMRVYAGDVHRGNGNTVDVDFMPTGRATFKLTGPEMRIIQNLQQKGVLRLDAPIPRNY